MVKVPKEIYSEIERRFRIVNPRSEAYWELYSMQNFLWWLDEWLDMELVEETNLKEAFAEDFPNTWGKETKPTEPEFRDDKLLMFWKVYNPFTNEWSEEKPTYWYIETSEMKKSEYWEIFREWFCKKSRTWYRWFGSFGFTLPYYWYTWLGDWNWYEIGHIPDFEWATKLSPQQWYDTIYDWEKPMDKWVEEKIEFLPPYEAGSELFTKRDRQVEALTQAVNKLISFHNSH